MFLVLALVGLVAACSSVDPCRMLCAHDGPAICTGGSWMKSNGICHGYLYIGDPANMNYCYHTSVTAPTCPASGVPVPAADVARLLEEHPSTSFTRREMAFEGSDTDFEQFILSLIAVAPSSTMIPSTTTTTTGGQSTTKNVAPTTTTVSPATTTTITATTRQRLIISAVQAMQIIRIISDQNDIPIFPGTERDFAIQSGFVQFCNMNSNMIRQVLSDNHLANWRYRPSGGFLDVEQAIRQYAYGRNLALYCPNILDTPFLRQIGLLHRHYARSLPMRLLRNIGISLLVNRAHAFDQSVQPLNAAPITSLSIGIESVRFIGEQAGGPGVVREWFTEVARQIYNPEYALFVVDESTRTTRICELSIHQDGYLNLYKSVGRFMALSILTENPVGVTLPNWFFSYMIGEQVELADIRHDDPVMHKSLSWILTATVEEIEVYNDNERVDGEAADPENEISISNRHAFVARRLQSLLREEVRPQFEAMRDGFLSLIPRSLIDGFVRGPDLRAMMFGNPEIDAEDLIQHIDFVDFDLADPRTEWMRNLLRTMTQQQLRAFVHFTTGNSQVPVGGFKNLSRRIQIDAGGSIDGLPTSSTCFYSLHLPLYLTEASLRTKVLQAITEGHGGMLLM